MKPRIATEESYLLYQNLCDNVFGVGVVKIKPASSNNIIGTLNYLDDYTENIGIDITTAGDIVNYETLVDKYFAKADFVVCVMKTHLLGGFVV